MTPEQKREAHKQLALELHRADREDWILSAQILARAIATLRGTVSSDDLWPVIPDPPKGVSRKAIAGAFVGMVKAGRKYSERAVCHHREIAVWRLP